MSISCVIELHDSDLESPLGLFPEQIEQDYWIAYHGTSSIFEGQIDTYKLRWTPKVCSKSEIEEMVSVCETMGWAGVSGGGFAVLKPLTLFADFGSSERKPIYLMEHSLLPSTYTMRDFAGRESARSIRYAYADLEQFFKDPNTILQHTNYLEQPYCESREIDLEWLEGRVCSFQDFYEGSVNALEQHKYGVVYAVRFCHADLESLRYCNSMGIRCFFDIAPERLVAKARMHSTDDLIANVSLKFNYFHEYRKRTEASDGLLSWFERGSSHG